MQAVLSRKIRGVCVLTTHVFCREISFCELATQTVLFTKIKVVLFVGFFHSFFFKVKSHRQRSQNVFLDISITVMLLQSD